MLHPLLIFFPEGRTKFTQPTHFPADFLTKKTWSRSEIQLTHIFANQL